MKNIFNALKVRSIQSMGHMKILFNGRMGFEPWGLMRPARMWLATGECLKPLFAGIWIRDKEGDRITKP